MGFNFNQEVQKTRINQCRVCGTWKDNESWTVRLPLSAATEIKRPKDDSIIEALFQATTMHHRSMLFMYFMMHLKPV